jgi:hypothetical protein
MIYFFSSPKRWNILSWFIKKRTSGEFSHCGMYDSVNKKLEHSNLKHGIHTSLHSEFAKKNDLVAIKIDATDEQVIKILQFIDKNRGYPYDAKGLLRGWWDSSKVRDLEGMYCSEYAIKSLITSGIIADNDELKLIHPTAVYNILLAIGGKHVQI